jgi:F-type H+-transporting ATPase subunit b
MNTIEKRENKIKTELDNAEQEKNKAQQLQTEFQNKNQVFDRMKEEMFNKLNEEVQQEKKKMIENARSDTQNLKLKLKKAMEEEQEKIRKNISDVLQKEIFLATKKTLQDVASSKLEENIVKIFLKKLSNLPETELIKLKSTKENQVNIIRTAFELSSTQQTEIEQEIYRVAGKKIQVRFEIKPELISGIELFASGFKLSWNISDYIKSFEQHIRSVTEENKINEKE